MGISIWQLVIVLGIVILLFGTKKLRNLGGDMGSAIHSFKKAMKSGEKDADQSLENKNENVIDAEATKTKDKDQA